MGASTAFGIGLAVIAAVAVYFYFKDPLAPVGKALEDAGAAIEQGVQDAKEATEQYQEDVHEDFIGPAANALGYDYRITHTDKLFSTVDYTPIAGRPTIHPLSFITPVAIANTIHNYMRAVDQRGRPVQGPPAPLAVRNPEAARRLAAIRGGGI